MEHTNKTMYNRTDIELYKNIDIINKGTVEAICTHQIKQEGNCGARMVPVQPAADDYLPYPLVDHREGAKT